MTADDVELIYGPAAKPEDTLAILNEAYGEDRFSREWLEWKHLGGPWGASKPVIARDGDDALGAVFVLPWHFRVGGTTVNGVRYVDGGTTPKARRRGVFGRIIRRELTEWDQSDTHGLLLATATPAAQASHVKNGAVALAPIHYGYQLPPMVRRARRDTGDSVIDRYVAPADESIRTDWDAAALRWRTDARSGHRYEACALAESDGPTGLVYRVVSSKVRVLVPLVAWGSPKERSTLLGATVWAERCPAVLAPGGAGSDPTPGRRVVRRGEVLVCVWDRRSGADRRVPSEDLSSWRLCAADVEGLI